MSKTWKDSFKESWFYWHKCELDVDGEFGTFVFTVTTDQKTYLSGRTSEIDKMCQEHIGTTPHTIRFEKDYDEETDMFYYTCICYFDKPSVLEKRLVKTNIGEMVEYMYPHYVWSIGVINNGTSFDIYVIGDRREPEYFITVTSKDGEQITDDVIESHIILFFDNADYNERVKKIFETQMINIDRENNTGTLHVTDEQREWFYDKFFKDFFLCKVAIGYGQCEYDGYYKYPTSIEFESCNLYRVPDYLVKLTFKDVAKHKSYDDPYVIRK